MKQNTTYGAEKKRKMIRTFINNAFINALSTYRIQINLKMIFHIHAQHRQSW